MYGDYILSATIVYMYMTVHLFISTLLVLYSLKRLLWSHTSEVSPTSTSLRTANDSYSRTATITTNHTQYKRNGYQETRRDET